MTAVTPTRRDQSFRDRDAWIHILGFAVTALVMTAAGCTSPREWIDNGFKVGPDYRKPAAPVETQWIDYQSDSRVSEDSVDTCAW
jgi:hypothetical protein